MTKDIDSWMSHLPDADQAVEELHQRVGRLSRMLDRILDEVAEAHAISRGDWTALSVVIRSGGSCTPGEIAKALQLTSGTVSTRIKRLATAGLIESIDSTAADARSRPVTVTAAGRLRWSEATAARTQRESRIVRDALTVDALTELNHGLAAALDAFERRLGPAARHDLPKGQDH